MRLSVIKPKKKSKYNNKKVVIDGFKFDSEREGERYLELKLMQKAGIISNLQLQVPFILAPGCVLDGRKKPAMKYKTDFVYEENGRTVIEDVKGKITALYRAKKHLMKTVLGLEIKEIR
jgi:hypothetical protein